MQWMRWISRCNFVVQLISLSYPAFWKLWGLEGMHRRSLSLPRIWKWRWLPRLFHPGRMTQSRESSCESLQTCWSRVSWRQRTACLKQADEVSTLPGLVCCVVRCRENTAAMPLHVLRGIMESGWFDIVPGPDTVLQSSGRETNTWFTYAGDSCTVVRINLQNLVLPLGSPVEKG